MPMYPVTTKGSDKRRVVEADNPAAAMKHAATAMFTIGKPMSAKEVVDHMRAGGEVEAAGETPADPAPAAASDDQE